MSSFRGVLRRGLWPLHRTSLATASLWPRQEMLHTRNRSVRNLSVYSVLWRRLLLWDVREIGTSRVKSTSHIAKVTSVWPETCQYLESQSNIWSSLTVTSAWPEMLVPREWKLHRTSLTMTLCDLGYVVPREWKLHRTSLTMTFVWPGLCSTQKVKATSHIAENDFVWPGLRQVST